MGTLIVNTKENMNESRILWIKIVKQITIDAEDAENIKHENTQQRTWIYMTYARCLKEKSSKNNCDIQTMVKGHKTQNLFLDNCQKQNLTMYPLQQLLKHQTGEDQQANKPVINGSRGLHFVFQYWLCNHL